MRRARPHPPCVSLEPVEWSSHAFAVEPAVFEPMVTAWLSTPSTAAGVIRFVVSELGAEFTAAEAQSQIAATGFSQLLNREFLDNLSVLDENKTLHQDDLLAIFYEHHADHLPSMPGQATERANKGPPQYPPGGLAERYVRLAEKAKAMSEHRLFRGLIGILIISVVLITGMDVSAHEQNGESWMQTTELVIIMVFVTEVLLKFVAQGLRPWRFFHIGMAPGTAPYSPDDHWQWLFNLRQWLLGIQGWNAFDFVVVVICVVQQLSNLDSGNMAVLRMVRLIKVLQLFMEVDQIRAVLIGLADGLHSLVFILIVFSVIFYIFGLVGMDMFGVTDEFHFNNLFHTFTTMARMAMGPWQDVLFINLYGCLDAKAHLGTPQIQESYCDGAENPRLLAISNDDALRRTAVVTYFLAFKAICGFVALSLLFGVITTAMAKALEETNKKKFEALRLKRQQGAQKLVLLRRNAARLEAEVDVVQRYSTKWWTIAGNVEVKMESIESMPDEPGRLRRRRICVTQATGLPLSDGSAEEPTPGDPYVIVFWNDKHLFKSGVVYNSVNPMWDESGIILIPPGGGVLRVEVFDWDADETVIPGILRCDAFQGEASISIGKDSESLGGVDCTPACKFYKLTEHAVELGADKTLLDNAAQAAAVAPEERTSSQLRAVCDMLETIQWFQINCPNREALLKVSKHVTHHRFAKGQVLYDHGSKANSMFIVIDGNVVLEDPDGKAVARMGAGATLGERALMGNMDKLMENMSGPDSDKEDDIDASKRYCTAIATSDTVVVQLTRKAFYSVPNRRVGSADAVASATGVVLRYKKISLKAFNLSNTDGFHWLVLGCIMIQAVVLGLETTVRNHELITESNEPFWRFINASLRLIFTAEVVVKALAYLNPWQEWMWFRDAWTLFDTIIVLMSWFPFTPKGLLILRILRLFRVLKEFNSLPQLQMIVNGLIDAVTGLWFVMLLLALIMYLYSIVGLQVLGVNDYRFRSLDSALLALSSVATEGSWPKMMYTNMYGCRDYYTPGNRCCNDRLGSNDTTPFGIPPLFFRVSSPECQPVRNLISVSFLRRVADNLSAEDQAKCPEHQPQPYFAAVYFTSFRLLVTFIILKLVVGTIIVRPQLPSHSLLGFPREVVGLVHGEEPGNLTKAY